MKLVWLHGWSLSNTDPAMVAHPDAPAIFVFDKPFLEQTRMAFPRLQFMFEAALEALAERHHSRICLGIQAEEIIAFAKLHHCTTICYSLIPSPELRRTLDALEQAGLKLEVYPVEYLTSYTGQVKRFSAFWREVEHEVLRG